jgi:hypothetical protein
MYFWKINSLKKHVFENGLSEAQTFYYILLFVGLSAIGIELMPYLPTENPNSWNYIESIINILIPTIGTIMAYRANGASEGKRFAGKYFSISFVMGIRFLVYLIPAVIMLGVYYGLSVDWSSPDVEQAFDTGWFEVLLFSGWYAAIYWRVVKHVRDVAMA